jgi:predicted acetyltransferase
VPIDIRPIHDDELPAWFDALSSGFLDRPDIPKIVEEVRPHWDLGRVWGAFVDGRISGTFRSWATEMTVPGRRQVKATAITAVGVLPTHRRRGILTKMAGAEHAAARERGEIVSILYASEYPIYGRFGYGPATTAATWTLDASSTGFHGTPRGTMELLPTDDAGEAAARDVFEAWRVRQPAEIWRRPITWLSDFGRGGSAWGAPWKGFLVVRRDDAGAIDGYARYHVEEKWEQRQPRNVLVVDDLHALTDEAYAELWRFVAAVDWVATVKAERRHPAERLPWLLTNARAAIPSDVGEGMWVKLLDIPAALAARTYEREADLILEVVARDGGPDGATERRVRVALAATPDGATARETDQDPDLTVDGGALGAAYLGGSRLRDAVLARAWDEHRPGALATADALFATLDPPWTSTFF